MYLRKKHILTLLIFIFIFSAIACTPTMLLIGIWVNEEDGQKTTLELKNDDNFIMTGEDTTSGTSISIPGTWENDDSNLTLIVDIDGENYTTIYQYSLNGDELTLTLDGESKVYIKQ